MKERLADAQAALSTLEELAIICRSRSATERFCISSIRSKLFWKVAALLLDQKEGIAVRSPKGAIRASRRALLLSDEDAEEAAKLAAGRNLTVHTYKQQIGEAIAERLPGHAAILRRWLDALQRLAAVDG